MGNETLVGSEETYNTSRSRGSSSDSTKSTQLHLDRNHSHYILVDEVDDAVPGSSFVNSKQNKLDNEGRLITPEWGSEVATRVLFEKTIRTLGEHSAVYIPSITLVCGGGLSSFLRIHESLKQNEPVIILKESGRVADAIVEYLKVRGLGGVGVRERN